MEEPPMKWAAVSAEQTSLSEDGLFPFGESPKRNMVFNHDLTSHESNLLADWESMWEEINSRLIIMRMVSDSVIKGMVRAVADEATEEVVIKEAEQAIVSEVLKNTVRLANEHIKELHMFSEALIDELKLEQNFEEAVFVVIMENYMKDIPGKFKMKLLEQHTQHRHHTSTVVEKIRNLNEEFVGIFKLNPSELVNLQFYGPREKNEDCTCQKFLENHTSQIAEAEYGGVALGNIEPSSELMRESVELMHMEKDEIINYFQSERNMLKRNHETKVQEMIEECFKLKREYLKEKGSFHVRKDKDLDYVRRRIQNIIGMMDSLLMEAEKLLAVVDCSGHIRILENQINTLLLENQHLKGLLLNKGDISNILLCGSNATSRMSHQHLAGAQFLNVVKHHENEGEDAMVEGFVKDETYKIIYKDVAKNLEDAMVEGFIKDETYKIIYKDVAKNLGTNFNAMLSKYNEEKEKRIFLEASLLECDTSLLLKLEENEKLKQEIRLLLASVGMKDRLANEAGFSLLHQQEKHGQLCQEHRRLQDKNALQEKLLSEKDCALNSLKQLLDEARDKIVIYELKSCETGQKLYTVENELNQAKKERELFQDIIQEKENTIYSAVENEIEQKKRLKHAIYSLEGSLEALTEFECEIMRSIDCNGSRLDQLACHCHSLIRQTRRIKGLELKYKCLSERKCADLLKAEEEVDLLGDEVDALLSLLGKIYVGLDHYSLMFQHYTGVRCTIFLTWNKIMSVVGLACMEKVILVGTEKKYRTIMIMDTQKQKLTVEQGAE